VNSLGPEEKHENETSHEIPEEQRQDIAANGMESEQKPDDDLIDSSAESEIEKDVDDIEPLTGISIDEILLERDEYLNLLQSVKAEFDNYKKRTDKRIDETRIHARGDLVEKLLPVLDACDAAVAQGADDVVAIRKALIDSLEVEGLKLVGTASEKFDPSIHEAISHEPGDEEDEGQLVIEVLRQGYFWEGKILRPAMVKVRG
tara:strand:+ start:2049 stop:2657 length:609 start_codon:yes stop_codon:yes gene_type:complete